MTPSTIVDKDESGLEMVLDALDKLNEERFIEGIRYRLRDAYEIGQVTEHLMSFQCRLNMEYRALTRFSENFIRLFATPNNKCFDTAQTLFNRIRSTLARVKDVFKEMTAIDRTQLPAGMEAPSVFEKSALASDSTQLELFGLDSFPQEARDLYSVIDTLFTTASMALTLCHQMIEKEKEVRNDPVLAKQSYDATFNEILGSVKGLTKYIRPSQEWEETEMDKSWQNTKEEGKFCQKWYHVPDDKQLTLFVIRRDFEQAQNEGLTKEERFFWKGNTEKALRVRHVIEHFEEVEGVEGQKGKLSSKVIVEFLKWCGVVKSQEMQLYKEYFVPTYLASHPKKHLKPIGWSTIDGERKKWKDNNRSDESMAAMFESRLIAIFPNVKTMTNNPHKNCFQVKSQEYRTVSTNDFGWIPSEFIRFLFQRLMGSF